MNVRRLGVALLTTIACGGEEPGSADASAAPAWPEVWGPTQIAEDQNPDPNIVEVTLEATRTTVTIDGEPVEMLAYNGSVPGPLIRVRKGNELIVHFRNGLDESTTIHWHGLRIPAEMDGSPRVVDPVKPGEEFTYRFTVPDSGSYWYHPHVRAHVQVEAGLYAPLVVWGEDDPEYDAERYLVLDDILLDDGVLPPPLENGQEMMFGRYGNMLLQNGQSEPLSFSLSQGRVERWRLVNAANARTMNLRMQGASFRVIGTDGGLLPEPYVVDKLSLTSGQRFDVEITTDQAGAVTMESELNPGEWVSVLEAEVTASDATPRTIAWPSIALPDRAADGKETVTIDAVNSSGGIEWRLNGVAHANEPLFTFAEGQTIDITLDNTIGPEHPFHVHGQFFQVLDDATQPGLKDTVLVPGFTKVKIRTYFDNPGRWMAHCHILEHAELGMMADIVVTPADGSEVPPPASGHGH